MAAIWDSCPNLHSRPTETAYEAVNKLKPGQYTAVLVVADPNSHQIYGFRIVKLISKEAAGQRELKDPRVQQAIREQLRDRREQLLKAAYYESIRDKAYGRELFRGRHSEEGRHHEIDGVRITQRRADPILTGKSAQVRFSSTR